MPFDAEEEITNPLIEFISIADRCKTALKVLGISTNKYNMSIAVELVSLLPKNSSDEELIDHIAKHLRMNYQPEAPSFILLDQ